ncbi:TPM domain-containing protein [Numidum massiliense]|uniref:TPM domain-containing protein n=1 Tax=Numidum massiliense TaxID=1522315 RepID=UPI0006D59DE1|nr:TPM domain-containing protein [Numidum massiliense]
MTRAARRSTTLVLAVIFLFGVGISTAYADVRIADQAELFDDETVEEIRSKLSSIDVDFYILTVKSTKGEDIDEIGVRTFREHEFNEGDVLLTIAVKERQADLIAPSKIDDPQKVLEEHFSPHAENDDYVTGIVKVAEYIDEYNTIGGYILEGIFDFILLLIINAPAVLAIVFIILLLLHPTGQSLLLILFSPIIWGVPAMIRRGKMRKQRNTLLTSSREALTDINRLKRKVQKRLAKSDGQTAKALAKIEKEVAPLQEKLGTLTKAIFGMKIPVRKKKKPTFDKLHKKYKAELKKHRTAIKKQTEAWQKIVSADKAVRTTTAQLEKQLAETRHNFQALQNDFLYTFEKLAQRVEAVPTALAQANALQTSDPLTAHKRLKDVAKMLQDISQSFALVPAHEAALNEWAQKIAQQREELAAIAKREKLQLVDSAPFANFDRALEQLKPLAEAIQAGDTKASLATLEAIDARVTDAFRQVETLVRLREQNRDALGEIEQTLFAYTSGVDDAFTEVMQRTEALFVETHWRHVPELFKQMKRKTADVREMLLQVKRANDPDVQQYKKAEEQIVAMRAALKEAATLKDECLSIYGTLIERRDSLQIARANSLQKYRAAQKKLDSGGILSSGIPQPEKLAEKKKLIQLGSEETEALLDTVPYDLDTAEEAVQRLASRVTSFTKEAKRLTEAKQKRRKKESEDEREE